MIENGNIVSELAEARLSPHLGTPGGQRGTGTHGGGKPWEASPVAKNCLVGGFALMVVYMGVRALITATTRPFWFDEVCTWTIVQQPGISGVWNALRHAADGQPLGFYLVEKIPRLFVAHDEIALRIPTVLAFCAVMLCVFTWIRTACGSIVAWICCLFLLFSPLRNYYATEARPYVLVAACLAFALVCYQRVDRRAFVVLLALTLAAAECFHYYAIFLVFPFGVAEAAFLLRNHKFRVGVWLALCSPMVPLLAFLPLLSRLKAAYGASFWAQPMASETLNVYSWLIGASEMSLPQTLPGRLLVIGSFLGATVFLMIRLAKDFSDNRPRLNETALLLGLLVSPWVMYLSLRLAHGGLTVRYMLPFTVTIPLVLAQFLVMLNRRTLHLIAGVLFLLLAVLEVSFWKYSLPMEREAFTPVKLLDSLLRQAGHPDLPVLISNPVDYLSLVHYASPPLASRLVEPLDTSAEFAYAQTDNLGKNLMAIAPYTQLNLPAYRDFQAQHEVFLLYTTSRRGTERMDWWTRRLRHDGVAMQTLAQWGDAEVYLVTLPESRTKGDPRD